MPKLKKYSGDLLLAIKKQEETTTIQFSLAAATIKSLKTTLDNDETKKKFWTNIYNAYHQILRKQSHNKPDIYKQRLFVIAGDNYSLDDLEHRILRSTLSSYRETKLN